MTQFEPSVTSSDPDQLQGKANMMLDHKLEDLLALQLDALIAGREFSATAAQHGLSADQMAEFFTLAGLASRLNAVMVPVMPATAFVERLRHDLTHEQVPTLIYRWRTLPPGAKLMARIGGVTLGAGLALLAGRRVVEVISAITTLNKMDPKSTVETATVSS